MKRVTAALLAGLLIGGAATPAAAATYDEALAALAAAHEQMRSGAVADAAVTLDRLIEETPADPEIADELKADIIASALTERAGVAWQAADGATAAALLQRAIDAYGEDRLKQMSSSYVLHQFTLAAMHAQAGAHGQAEAAYDRALAHIDVLFEEQVNNQLAFQIVFKREMTRAFLDLAGATGEAGVDNAASATEVAESLGTPYASVHRLTEAFALAAVGRLDEAAAKADGAAAGGLPFGRDYVSRAMLFRAGALGALDRREEALKLARAAEGYAESNDAQVAVLQLLNDVDGQADGAPWPTRFDPRSEDFFMVLAPRMRLTSEIRERGETRLPRPVVNVGYAFDFRYGE